jgi:hypothetical protein
MVVVRLVLKLCFLFAILMMLSFFIRRTAVALRLDEL